MLRVLRNIGPKNPWGGAWGAAGGTKKPEIVSEEENKKPVADFDQFFKKLFGGDSGGESGGSKNSDNKNSDNKNNFINPDLFSKNSKSTTGLVILGTVLLWLCLGFYKVDADENAVVLYFGKFHSITTSGLNYHVPYPFGKAIVQSVSRVNIEEFGFSSSSNSKKDNNFNSDALMLTGDENIVDIEFQVQWQVSDIKDFIFNIASPQLTIRKSAQSAMREIIARTPIVSALSGGKGKIEMETKELLQEILDSYNAGVRIVLVQLRRVDPPSQVIDAFRDVQTAKADKEKEINEAEAYANDVIPRARGSASQITEQAEAYSKEVVTNAQGEAGRFLSIYGQYNNSKNVTKKRIYLETMEKIYRDVDKVIIDKKLSESSMIGYLPLSELNKTNKENNN